MLYILLTCIVFFYKVDFKIVMLTEVVLSRYQEREYVSNF
jgi:hypothetical protein